MSSREGTLAEVAAEVVADGDLPADPAEAAEEVARQVRLVRPDVTLRSARAAAARALGQDPPLTEAEERAALAESDRRRPGARARRAAAGGVSRARRAGRRAARQARPRLGGRPRSVAALAGQAFGLVVLYWLLRTPEVVDRVTRGAGRALGWILTPGGVPALPVVGPGGASAAGAAGVVTAPPGAPGGVPLPNSQVERWRPLIARYFPAGAVNQAVEVMACESSGNPNARNPSGASGLFQHMPEFWSSRSAAAGWPGANIFDPEANVAVAAWLYRRDGWRHWLASQPCWGD